LILIEQRVILARPAAHIGHVLADRHKARQRQAAFPQSAVVATGLRRNGKRQQSDNAERYKQAETNA
jgi:hypothetical protein